MNNLDKIGVYKITTPSNKVYIGMTTSSFKNRWNSHLKSLKNPNKSHHCKGLQRAFDKYGWDNLNKEILQAWDKPNDLNDFIILENKILLIEKETYLAYKDYDYNMLHACPSGTGSVIKNEDIRKAISDGVKASNTVKSYCRIFNLICISCKLPFTCKNATGKYCSRKECVENRKLIKPRVTRLNNNHIEEIKRFYKDGKSIPDIAKIYEVSVGTVYNFMKKYDINRRNFSDAMTLYRSDSNNNTKFGMKKGYTYDIVKCENCYREIGRNNIIRHLQYCNDNN